MKALTTLALAVTLVSGTALAADPRQDIDTDLIHGGAMVSASGHTDAYAPVGGRSSIATDLIRGTASVTPTSSEPLGRRVVNRGEIDTDLLYGG